MRDPTLDARPMRPGATRREALLGGALLATAGIAFARTPDERRSAIGKEKLEAIVPERIGDWEFEFRSGLILPPPDQLQDKIYSQLVTRQYRRGDEAIMLLIAYSDRQDGAIQVHRPEVCYPASGMPIREIDTLDLALPGGRHVPLRHLLATNDTRNEEMIYWVRIGEYFPAGWLGSHWSVMRENLVGIIPDGVLVRISRVSNALSPEILSGFAQDLVTSGGPTLRRVLVG